MWIQSINDILLNRPTVTRLVRLVAVIQKCFRRGAGETVVTSLYGDADRYVLSAPLLTLRRDRAERMLLL